MATRKKTSRRAPSKKISRRGTAQAIAGAEGQIAAASDDDMFELMDLSIDLQKRDNGAWIYGTRNYPHLHLKVLGHSAPKIAALDIALQKDRPDDYEKDDKIAVERNKYENRQKAKLALLDWKPFKLAGVPVKYSEAKKKELLDDPRFIKFLVATMAAMDAAEVIKIDWEKDAEKNSAAGSGSNSQNEGDLAA